MSNPSHQSHSPVYFGGSRSASPSLLQYVPLYVRAVQARGQAVHVGCAPGVDTAAIYAALVAPSLLSVFAVGDQFGYGFPGSSVGQGYQAVSLAQHSAASVHWLAGGSLHVPLRARLIKRSMAGFSGCSLAVFILENPKSKGSLAVASQATTAGLPVFAFLPGFTIPPARLASSPGQWVRATFPFSSGITNNQRRGWQWQPAQAPLF